MASRLVGGDRKAQRGVGRTAYVPHTYLLTRNGLSLKWVRISPRKAAQQDGSDDPEEGGEDENDNDDLEMEVH